MLTGKVFGGSRALSVKAAPPGLRTDAGLGSGLDGTSPGLLLAF
ncbi:hypothetical protein BN2537_493 [Streptomyces venezuelae]|nr:hypothetical protein BN2537_493 [Streptomyces venezuelae]